MAQSPFKPSTLDADQVLQYSYDEAAGALRVEGVLPQGAIEVAIDADSGDNIAIKDPASGNELKINNDGSINAVISLTPPVPGDEVNIYSEVNSVANGITTSILTYTVPIGKTFNFLRAEVTGTNIAQYWVTFNGTTNAKKYTYFGGALNADFNFSDSTSSGGYPLIAGTQIIINVLHIRPNVGDFAGRIQGIES